jgi:hypothetical protein
MATDLAQVFAEMSDGILWKDPEIDGHFSRAAKRLKDGNYILNFSGENK